MCLGNNIIEPLAGRELVQLLPTIQEVVKVDESSWRNSIFVGILIGCWSTRNGHQCQFGLADHRDSVDDHRTVQ